MDSTQHLNKTKELPGFQMCCPTKSGWSYPSHALDLNGNLHELERNQPFYIMTCQHEYAPCHFISRELSHLSKCIPSLSPVVAWTRLSTSEEELKIKPQLKAWKKNVILLHTGCRCALKDVGTTN